MIQVGLQKACDMVEWDFIEKILKEFGFPNKFIDWVMNDVKNVSYRFNINGNYTHVMEAKRGIRKGGPISPLLFVLLMEYLTRLLQQLDKVPDFNYHAKYERMKITISAL